MSAILFSFRIFLRIFRNSQYSPKVLTVEFHSDAFGFGVIITFFSYAVGQGIGMLVRLLNRS